jgi:hypothetical protein
MAVPASANNIVRFIVDLYLWEVVRRNASSIMFLAS